MKLNFKFIFTFLFLVFKNSCSDYKLGIVNFALSPENYSGTNTECVVAQPGGGECQKFYSSNQNYDPSNPGVSFPVLDFYKKLTVSAYKSTQGASAQGAEKTSLFQKIKRIQGHYSSTDLQPVVQAMQNSNKQVFIIIGSQLSNSFILYDTDSISNIDASALNKYIVGQLNNFNFKSDSTNLNNSFGIGLLGAISDMNGILNDSNLEGKNLPEKLDSYFIEGNTSKNDSIAKIVMYFAAEYINKNVSNSIEVSEGVCKDGGIDCPEAKTSAYASELAYKSAIATNKFNDFQEKETEVAKCLFNDVFKGSAKSIFDFCNSSYQSNSEKVDAIPEFCSALGFLDSDKKPSSVSSMNSHIKNNYQSSAFYLLSAANVVDCSSCSFNATCVDKKISDLQSAFNEGNKVYNDLTNKLYGYVTGFSSWYTDKTNPTQTKALSNLGVTDLSQLNTPEGISKIINNSGYTGFNSSIFVPPVLKGFIKSGKASTLSPANPSNNYEKFELVYNPNSGINKSYPYQSLLSSNPYYKIDFTTGSNNSYTTSYGEASSSSVWIIKSGSSSPVKTKISDLQGNSENKGCLDETDSNKKCSLLTSIIFDGQNYKYLTNNTDMSGLNCSSYNQCLQVPTSKDGSISMFTSPITIEKDKDGNISGPIQSCSRLSLSNVNIDPMVAVILQVISPASSYKNQQVLNGSQVSSIISIYTGLLMSEATQDQRDKQQTQGLAMGIAGMASMALFMAQPAIEGVRFLHAFRKSRQTGISVDQYRELQSNKTYDDWVELNKGSHGSTKIVGSEGDSEFRKAFFRKGKFDAKAALEEFKQIETFKSNAGSNVGGIKDAYKSYAKYKSSAKDLKLDLNPKEMGEAYKFANDSLTKSKIGEVDPDSALKMYKIKIDKDWTLDETRAKFSEVGLDNIKKLSPGRLSDTFELSDKLGVSTSDAVKLASNAPDGVTVDDLQKIYKEYSGDASIDQISDALKTMKDYGYKAPKSFEEFKQDFGKSAEMNINASRDFPNSSIRRGQYIRENISEIGDMNNITLSDIQSIGGVQNINIDSTIKIGEKTLKITERTKSGDMFKLEEEGSTESKWYEFDEQTGEMVQSAEVPPAEDVTVEPIE